MSFPSVSIGLLWDETAISGEFIGPYSVECWTDCNRKLDLPNITGKFEARFSSMPEHLPPASAGGSGGVSFAIRLAECLSKERAEYVLSQLPELPDHAGIDILEAGRHWKLASQDFDNRVWWPVIKLAAKEHAQPFLDTLRAQSRLNPFGFAVVPIGTSSSALAGGSGGGFNVTIGDYSTTAIRVIARPLANDSIFNLHHVPIGRGFHWERKETLSYRGTLRVFSLEQKGLTAANELPLETYLESAVGSEMRSDLPPAFSQAQAIAARSTVLATANRHHYADGFDLCNDDHCQCYQGVAREANAVIAPIRESAGQVLVSSPPTSSGGTQGGNTRSVVDARYAKACGGISELYESCWGEDGPDYFTVRACGDFEFPELSDETAAKEFIHSPPPAWCNGDLHPYPEPWDKDPLFRWSFTRTRKEWAVLLKEKTGIDVGAIREFKVIQRGPSGRILTLEIHGEEKTRSVRSVYGELNIRRALSPSHLPSSFFVIDYDGDRITLTGGGWGHGVGLCQLGAAAMAKAGWSVEKILKHYYPGSELETLKA